MRAALNVEILRRLPKVGGHQYVYQLVGAMDGELGGDELLLLNNSFRRGVETKPELPATSHPGIIYKNIKVSKKLVSRAQKLAGFPRLEHLAGRIDVYHEPALDPFPLTRAAKALTIHDLSPITGRFTPPDYTEMMRAYYGTAIQGADVIIASSEYTRQDIIENYRIDESRVKRVYLAAKPAPGIPSDKSIAAARAKFGIADEYMIFVSTLEPKKNVPNIIRAYNAFRTESSSAAQLVLCGYKGWMSDEIDAELERTPYRKDIILTGFVDDEILPALMKGALFLLYPSIYEGFGLPVLEAMAMGLPVLTSNATSLPEVAGDAAIIVDPSSVAEMSDGMRRLAEDSSLRAEMVKKGFAQCAKFSWERCAKETLKIYREIS